MAVSKGVQKLMESKVDFSDLKRPGSYLSLHEKLAHELAEEIEIATNPRGIDYISVSWEAQVEAQDYFNKHGFEKTLDRLTTMREKRGYYEED